MLFDPDYDPNHVWMAREKGQVLGLLVTSLRGDTAWIKLLAVEPSHQRQGLARQMLERAEDRLEGEGAKNFLIEATPPWQYFPGVPVGQQATLAFFASMGYRQGEQGHMTWLAPAQKAEPAPALDAADWVAWVKEAAPTDADALEEALSYRPPRALGVIQGSRRALCAFEPGRSVGPAVGDDDLARVAAQGAWKAASQLQESLLVLDRHDAPWWDGIADKARRDETTYFYKTAGASPV